MILAHDLDLDMVKMYHNTKNVVSVSTKVMAQTDTHTYTHRQTDRHRHTHTHTMKHYLYDLREA